MPELKEFLNPTSVLTPGIAGGITVSVGLPLAIHFGLSFKWVALIISFLLSLTMVLSCEEKCKGILKGLYCVLNTLIIFSMSIGVGTTVDPPPKMPELSYTRAHVDHTSFLLRVAANAFGVPAAVAAPQPENAGVETNDNQSTRELEARIQALEREKAEAEERTRKNEAMRSEQQQQIENYQKKIDKYNKRWSW